MLNWVSDLHVYNITKTRSEEHTSELQSHSDLVCRLLLEKKKKKKKKTPKKTKSEIKNRKSTITHSRTTNKMIHATYNTDA